MVLTASDVKSYEARIEKSIKDPRKRALKKLDVAKLYKDANCFEEARESAREYLKVNPKDHRAYNLLAAVSEELEEWDSALRYYKRSIELQRSQKDIFIKIVVIYSRVSHEEPGVAKVWADKAEAVMPNHPAIFDLRWSLLMNFDERDFEEMEGLLAQELVRRPKDPSLHIKLVELYTEKGDLEEAYSHCKSLHMSQVFQNDQDWLFCCAENFKQYFEMSRGKDEGTVSFMNYIQVLCCLLDVVLKVSSYTMAREIFQRLDEAACGMLSQKISSVDLQNEFEMFRTEIRGQIYFNLAALILKKSQEKATSWNSAVRLACACLAVSSSIGVPDKRAAWFLRKPPPENLKMQWHVMACMRRSQTDHLLWSLAKQHGIEFIDTCASDICSEPGKIELVHALYGERRPSQKSFLMMDKEFFMTEYEMPDLDALLEYDQVAIKEHPSNLELITWIGMNAHYSEGLFKPEAFVGELFSEIQFEAKDLKNCEPFTLSSIDLKVFIQAVRYSGIERLMSSEDQKADFEPLFYPLSISPSLCTNSQLDWWDAAYRLHTGKTWQVSTSKLKSILQRGIEALRLIGSHGIDAVILQHISESFLAKADEIQNSRENDWSSQVILEAYRRRGFYYGDEALKLLELNKRDYAIARPKAQLIPPLLIPIDENKRSELIEVLRTTLADAAFRDDECVKALEYLNGLFTADAAYKQAQIYRDLASRENHTNVEGLRSHLSFLRKSRDVLQTCLSRLDKTQAALREKVQAEIEEIKDAITEQSGISAVPSTVVDRRYSFDDIEDEQEVYRPDEENQDDTSNEAKLMSENSALHEQLAVRNHEFSVLAAMIHKLEREMSEMRANQSGSESILKPRQDSSVNTDESSSSAVYVPKDDVTSGSGNLTPRLEPEMSWDTFSPAPVFPVGFFSGLVNTVEKIEEETETEVDANPDEKVSKAQSLDTSGQEEKAQCDEDHSFGDNLHVKPLVSLNRISDLTTGEEDEHVVFKDRAKLYRLHDGQWKERGVGDLKILFNKGTSKSRILMRREKVFKVCANHLLTDDMKLTKKAESSNTYVWCTPADMSDVVPTAETFAVRFKTEGIAQEFSDTFEKYKGFLSVEGKEIGNVQLKDNKEDKKNELEAGKDRMEEKTGTMSFDFSKFAEKQNKEAVKCDASAFSFKLGPKIGAQKYEEGKESGEKQSEMPKFDFKNVAQPQPFSLDPAKFKFDFGGQVSGDNKNTSGGSNPFLAAINTQSASSSPSTKNQPDGRGIIATSSPFGPGPAVVQASTPFTESLFQGANTAWTESTPNYAIFSSPNAVSPVTSYGAPRQGTDNQVNDYLNAAAAQGTSQQITGQIPDQGRYFQNDWENMQDRYYDAPAAAYDAGNQYYDEESFYQNEDDYYNDGEYYTAEDVYYGDDAYYANSEQGFEYYDQEPAQNIAAVGSEASSDRLSPQNDGVTPTDELVPRVVQVIDDDIFVTYVKKASFAQRAKASRLHLPANFYAPSSYPPCSGCCGCWTGDVASQGREKKGDRGLEDKTGRVPSEKDLLLKKFDIAKPASFWVQKPTNEIEKPLLFGAAAATEPSIKASAEASTTFLKSVDKKTQDGRLDKPAIFGETAGMASGDNSSDQKFLSFAELVNSGSKNGFSGSASKSFSGAGSVLFAAKEEADEGQFDATFKPIVELKKEEDQKTGEEGYVDLFKNRAKLFRFDFDAKQWKERGVGDMKLSYNPETSYCRVIMRRDQILKLCANHPIMPDIELKPHGMSATSWVWVSGADYSEGEPKMQQFAVRFKKKEIADEFERVFRECQKKIVKYLDGLDGKSSNLNESGAERQLSNEPAQSKPCQAEDDIVVTYVNKPSQDDERRALRLYLPKAFFAPLSVPPCTGCRGCKEAAHWNAFDKTDGGAVLKGHVLDKKETDTEFLSFADLASSGTANQKAFVSSAEGFAGAGRALFVSPKGDENPLAFDATFKPIVELKKEEDQKTGEEGYVDLFKNRAKLFRFDFDAKQWKERGVGDMKLSYNPETSYCRVIMRRDQILKLCANHPIMPDIELKPHGMSATSWVWVSGADYSEGEPQLQQFAVRFKKKEIADEFRSVFQKCQGIIKKYLEDNKLSLSQTAENVSEGESKETVKEISATDKLGQDSGISVKCVPSSTGTSTADGVTGFTFGQTGASFWSNGRIDVDKQTSTWICSSCFATNVNSGIVCKSCNASKPTDVPSGSFSIPQFGGFPLFKTNAPNESGQQIVVKEERRENAAFVVASQLSSGKEDATDSWACPHCKTENLSGNESCVACNKEKPRGIKQDQSKPQKGTKVNIFAAFKPKEGSWECPTCMIQNKKEDEKCASCGTESPGMKQVDQRSTSSEAQKSAKVNIFAAFKPKEGSWECPTCMVQNKKEDEKCASCGTESPVIKQVGQRSTSSEAQKSTKVNIFAAFKPKEGSWECPTCMVHNKKEDEKCASCGTESPTAKPQTLNIPLFGQQSNAFKMFGGQIANPFQAGSATTSFPKPVFSMPSFSIGNIQPSASSSVKQEVEQKDMWECPTCSVKNSQHNTACENCKTEKASTQKEKPSPQIVLRESPLSKLNNPLLAFQPKSDSWECSICALSNTKDAMKCISCSADKPAPVSDKDTRKGTTEQTSGMISLFGTPVGASSQANATPFSNFWTSATPKFKLGQLNVGGSVSTPQQPKGDDAGEVLFYTPSSTTPITSRSDLTPKSPESPTKVEGGGINCTPLVSLEKVENQKTGEEDEVVLFCDKAKLYRFDTEVKQWKERGVGELKILQKCKEKNKYRLLMRRDQIHKICANHSLIRGMVLTGMPKSDKMKIWTTAADFAGEEVKKETFAVRFKSPEALQSFEVVFKKATEDGDASEQSEEKNLVHSSENDVESKEEEETSCQTSSGVEDIDVKLTEVVLPSNEDQSKAEKLLLPKEFYNKQPCVDVSSYKTLVDDVKSRTPEKSQGSTSFIEIFATPKVSLIGSKSDVTPNVGPRSPEKFSEDCSASFTPIVQLNKIETETGEEKEDVVFCEKSKLYRYDSAGREWKERGFGELKILKNAELNSARMIMRRDQVKKICLNHSILPGMQLEFMGNRRNTLIWFTHADYAEEEARAEKFAAKFKNEDITKRFKECFEEMLQGKESPSFRAGSSIAGAVDEEGKGDSSKEESREKAKDKPAEIGTAGEVSSDVETVSSFDNFLLKDQESSALITTIKQQGTTTAPTSTKSSFTWPGSTTLPVFTFNSDIGATKEQTSDDTKKEFSWPAAGTMGLFSIGSGSSSSKQDVGQTVVDNQSFPDQGTSVTTTENLQETGLFGFQCSSPFTSKASDKSPSGSNDEQRNLASFKWSGTDKSKIAPVFDFTPKKEDSSKKESEVHDAYPKSPEKLEEKEVIDPSEAIVSLEKVESCTGEEDEIVVYSEWAKAYRFDDETRQWKERGKGDLKILHHKTTGLYRLLMRRDHVKKVAVNHAITKEMKLEANSTARNSWIWFTHADFSDEVAKPEKLAIRFRDEEKSNRFKSAFDAAVSELVNEPKDKETSKDEAVKRAICLAKVPITDDHSTQIVATVSGDVLITYVKMPTDEERDRADALLLPRTFFAAPNSEKRITAQRMKKDEIREEKAEVSETNQPRNCEAWTGFKSSEALSFASLSSQSTGMFPGLKFSPEKQQIFKGQGSALFSKVKENDENEGVTGEEDYLNSKPIVSLTKTETKTGEEDEDVKFMERCKLYRFDKDNNQWKERGVGEMKILYNKSQGTSRVIMRRDVVYKLGANHLIQPGMNLKSKQGVDTTWVWKTTADIADEVPREDTFTVKFKTAEIGRRFADVFERCANGTIEPKNGSEIDKPKDVEESDHFQSQDSDQDDPATAVPSKQDDSTVTPAVENVSSTSIIGIKADSETKISGSQIGSPRDVTGRDSSGDITSRDSPAVTEEKRVQNTFGSRFSGLDFSTLAKSDSIAFKNTSEGGFANAGAQLFGSKSEHPEEHDPRLEAIVQLEKVEAKSGEEEEEVVFESWVKLYRFSKEVNQWKERGVGTIKLLRHKETRAGRLVMRRDVVLKIAANHSLTNGIKLDVMKSAVRTLVWKAIADVSDGDPTDCMFAAKFKAEDIMQKFTRVFEALCCGEEFLDAQETKDQNQQIVGSCSPEISKALQDYLDKK